jgi:hypothetical protein
MIINNIAHSITYINPVGYCDDGVSGMVGNNGSVSSGGYITNLDQYKSYVGNFT